MENLSPNHENFILIILGVFVVIVKNEKEEIYDRLSSLNLLELTINLLGKLMLSNLTLPLYILQTILISKQVLKKLCSDEPLISNLLNFLGKTINKESFSIKNKKLSIKIYCLIVENNEGKKLLSLKVPKALFSKQFYTSLDSSAKSLVDSFHQYFKGNKKLLKIINNIKNGDTNNEISVQSFDTNNYFLNDSDFNNKSTNLINPMKQEKEKDNILDEIDIKLEEKLKTSEKKSSNKNDYKYGNININNININAYINGENTSFTSLEGNVQPLNSLLENLTLYHNKKIPLKNQNEGIENYNEKESILKSQYQQVNNQPQLNQFINQINHQNSQNTSTGIKYQQQSNLISYPNQPKISMSNMSNTVISPQPQYNNQMMKQQMIQNQNYNNFQNTPQYNQLYLSNLNNQNFNNINQFNSFNNINKSNQMMNSLQGNQNRDFHNYN